MAALFALGAGVAATAVAILAGAAARRRRRAGREEVGARQRRFEATFERAAVGISHLDLEGRWIRVNDRLCELTGYSREALLATSFPEITHPDDRAKGVALREALAAGDRDEIRIEKRYIRPDGTIVWARVTASLVRDGAGEPDFVLAFIEDITERKRAEARLISTDEQHKAIFERAVESIAVIDAEGVIQSVNPAVEQTFLYTPDELIGRNIKILMPPENAGEHDDYLRRYRETGRRAIIGIGREVVGRRKDGTLFPLDLSVAEWQRTGETFFTGIMRDISARKDAETALRASEDKLRLLQNELAHLARVNDLGEMAAAISHEINQPLTAIVNYLNTGLFLARDGYSEDAFVEAEEMMRGASDQALRAGDIVRRLREFVGHGAPQRSVERAAQLVDSAISLALIDARTSGIAVDRFGGADDAEVEVDPIQIQQVLANLLRNAVEAMTAAPRAGVRPRLTVGTAEAPDGKVEFIVADNGPGIPPELEGRLFQPFVTSKSKGMGMGLSVCRRLIESHGGAIEVDNRPGEGAVFRFRLPRFDASGRTAEKPTLL